MQPVTNEAYHWRLAAYSGSIAHSRDGVRRRRSPLSPEIEEVSDLGMVVCMTLRASVDAHDCGAAVLAAAVRHAAPGAVMAFAAKHALPRGTSLSAHMLPSELVRLAEPGFVIQVEMAEGLARLRVVHFHDPSGSNGKHCGTRKRRWGRRATTLSSPSVQNDPQTRECPQKGP